MRTSVAPLWLGLRCLVEGASGSHCDVGSGALPHSFPGAGSWGPRRCGWWGLLQAYLRRYRRLNAYWLGWSPSTFYRVYSIEVSRPARLPPVRCFPVCT